jgi:hypothetical protein
VSTYGGPPAARAEPRDSLLVKHLRRAAEATGVKITDVLEPGGTPYLEKRMAEHAGGAAGVDVLYNQLNWHLPLGLQGALVDHAPYFRRDKVDTRQWYQASFEQRSWKGKRYAIAYQTGARRCCSTRRSSKPRASSSRTRTGPTTSSSPPPAG